MSFRIIKVDGPVKSRKRPFFVIPVKTGIQVFQLVTNHLDSGACPGPDPGFTGVTTFYEAVKVISNRIKREVTTG